MFYFKDNANPVGIPHKLDEIEEKIRFYCSLWDAQKNSRHMRVPKINLSVVTNFLLAALDDFVITISAVVISGPDKKATVLNAIDKIYEYVVREALPIWLRPFAGVIKQYIVYVLISNAIDWMVSKYKSGSWKTAHTALERVLFMADQRMFLCGRNKARRICK